MKNIINYRILLLLFITSNYFGLYNQYEVYLGVGAHGSNFRYKTSVNESVISDTSSTVDIGTLTCSNAKTKATSYSCSGDLGRDKTRFMPGANLLLGYTYFDTYNAMYSLDINLFYTYNRYNFRNDITVTDSDAKQHYVLFAIKERHNYGANISLVPAVQVLEAVFINSRVYGVLGATVLEFVHETRDTGTNITDSKAHKKKKHDFTRYVWGAVLGAGLAIEIMPETDLKFEYNYNFYRHWGISRFVNRDIKTGHAKKATDFELMTHSNIDYKNMGGHALMLALVKRFNWS